MNVISGGYMPEYGRTTGGVLSAITKTGSNEFHGGAFSYYSPGGLAGTPKVVPQAIDTVIGTSPLAYSYDIGADVGGPIVKDKLWFYVGFDYSTENYDVNRAFYSQIPDGMGGVKIDPTTGNPATQHINGLDQHFSAVSQTFQAIGKLTYALNDDNKLTATFIASPTQTGGNGRFAVDPTAGGPETNANGFSGTYSSLAHKLDSASYDTNLKWSTELDNKRILVDTIAGWHHQYNDVLPADGTLPGSGQGLSAYPNVQWAQSPNYHGLPEFEGNAFKTACTPPPGSSVNTLCPLTSYSSGGPTGQIGVQTYDRYTLGSTLTYLFQGLGHHVVKVGVSGEYTVFDHLKGHSGGTNIIESTQGQLSDAEHFGVLIGPDNPSFLEPFHIVTKSTIAGGFIQDSWSVLDKFTLNVGLRYDIQLMQAADGSVGLTMPNEWAPRVGIIYDPTNEGRSKIFANYARYYENVPLGLADGSLSGEPSVLATYGTSCNSTTVSKPNGCQNNQNRTIGNALNGSPTPYAPSQKWGTFGAGAEPVDPNIQPTTTDEIVGGFEYEILKDMRAGVTYDKRWIVRWIEDMSNDNRQTFFIGNPGYGIAQGFPQASRDYDAGTLYVMKNFSDEWLLSASYTLSSLRGNIGGLFGQNGELDPNHNAAFDTKTIMVNSYGPLPGDHTHDIKIFGAKDWKLTNTQGFSTGMAFRAKSGTPLDFFASDASYGQGTYLLEPRGSAGRLPWVYDIDVNLGYRYSIDKDKTYHAGSRHLQSLFNFQDVTSVDENYTLANATGVQNGTLAQATVYPSGSPARPLNLGDKNPNFLNPAGFQESSAIPLRAPWHVLDLGMDGRRIVARGTNTVKSRRNVAVWSSVGAVVVAVAGPAGCSEPAVRCTAQDGEAIARYEIVSQTGACDSMTLPGLANADFSLYPIGVESYVPTPSDPNAANEVGSMALQPEWLGAEFEDAQLNAATDPTLPPATASAFANYPYPGGAPAPPPNGPAGANYIYSWGKFATVFPDASGICKVPTLGTSSLDYPAIPAHLAVATVASPLGSPTWVAATRHPR